MKIYLLSEFHLLRNCFKTEAEEIKICTRRTVDFVERWALELFGEILDLMCYNYPEESDKCDRIIAQVPKLNFTGIQKPKSFIPPLLHILKVIGDYE